MSWSYYSRKVSHAEGSPGTTIRTKSGTPFVIGWCIMGQSTLLHMPGAAQPAFAILAAERPAFLEYARGTLPAVVSVPVVAPPADHAPAPAVAAPLDASQLP